jgi:hypothetical protein
MKLCTAACWLEFPDRIPFATHYMYLEANFIAGSTDSEKET